ncbi:hypothetical protein CMESO_346 (nucleomorph) [Chroomonas mesostigmatica CCMP1168]|uniref:Uncharacterized protein n=1 Tax=Chroomonas mesostigmatica CCMP1168 TaxID=1195612 RepID=J7G8A2_9CRYP|nr:hypothetical protein CMESO_346 [Chroomonas mesostigmatica CCMP1168]
MRLKRIFLKLKFKSIHISIQIDVWVSFPFKQNFFHFFKKTFFLIKKKCLFFRISFGKIILFKYTKSNLKITNTTKKQAFYNFEINFGLKNDSFLKKIKKISKTNVYCKFSESFIIFPFVFLLNTMENNKKRKKNYFLYPFFRKKDILYNDIFFLLMGSSENFLEKYIESKSLNFLIIFTEAIWILDNQYEKLWKRKIQGEKIHMPSDYIMNFFSQKNYFNIQEFSRKQKKIYKNKNNKIMKKKNLSQVCKKIKFLFNTNNFPISQTHDFSPILDAFSDLTKTFLSYGQYMLKSLTRAKQNHERNNFRDIKKFIKIKTLEIVFKNNNKKKYFEILEKVEKYLKSLSNYIPFDLSKFLPSNKHERAKIFDKISFSTPVEILEYFPGSNKRKIIICWKIPLDKNSRNMMKKNSIILEQINRFPVFYSRKMLKTKIGKKNI